MGLAEVTVIPLLDKPARIMSYTGVLRKYDILIILKAKLGQKSLIRCHELAGVHVTSSVFLLLKIQQIQKENSTANIHGY